MSTKSGLQGQVIQLYRRWFRSIRTKPLDAQPKFRLYTQYQFRHPSKGGGVSKRDFTTIEYLIRQGKKTVELWEAGTVNDCWVTKDMVKWGETARLGRRK